MDRCGATGPLCVQIWCVSPTVQACSTPQAALERKSEAGTPVALSDSSGDPLARRNRRQFLTL
jgi:hypothetical protein